MQKKIKKLSEIGINKNQVVYVHRGRNKILSDFFLSQCIADYNYDFRGLKRLKIFNKPFHLVKSFLTAFEIERAKFYLLEGGLFIPLGFYLKILNPKSKIIFNIADPTLALFSNNIFARFKYHLKIRSLRFFDIYLSNSMNVCEELTKITKNKSQIYHYYLNLFDKKLKSQP